MSRRLGIGAGAVTGGAESALNAGATIEFGAELDLAAELEAEDAEQKFGVGPQVGTSANFAVRRGATGWEGATRSTANARLP